jgi:DNA polymerase-3 subunit epsilon
LGTPSSAKLCFVRSQTRLFSRLRQHHQERERLRLIVSYRNQFLEALLRKEPEEAEHVQREYREAQARIDGEYEETAAAMAAKKELTGDEEVELAKLWKTLVKLYHPDRFAHEPDKLETYSKLTATINRAKDSGDLDTLRQIGSDPHGFILRQGWASLDFREEEHAARLGKLLESLEMEILSVLEATNQLRASPEFELYELTAKNALATRKARADARLAVAVVRGLLLDLLATGDRAGVTEAYERFLQHVSATGASPPASG